MNNHLYGSKNSEFRENKQVENFQRNDFYWKVNGDTTKVLDPNYVHIDSIDDVEIEEFHFLRVENDWIRFDIPDPQYPGGPGCYERIYSK